jgi:hypothetical protein
MDVLKKGKSERDSGRVEDGSVDESIEWRWGTENRRRRTCGNLSMHRW